MKLDKAVVVLRRPGCWVGVVPDPDFINALKLGIEALKAYQKAKSAGWYPPGYKLPGETEG